MTTITAIVAVKTAAETTADYDLADGASHTLTLNPGASLTRIPRDCSATVQRKTSSGYVDIARLDADFIEGQVYGPGQYRVVKNVSVTPFGVDQTA